MQKIIYFLIRNKNFILFLALLTVSLVVNFNFNEYNRSKIMNSSNFIISSLYEVKFSVTKYLNLEYQNKLFSDQIHDFWMSIHQMALTRCQVAVECHLGLNEQEEQQLFFDLNSKGKTVAKSLAYRFDHTDPINSFVADKLIGASILPFAPLDKDETNWHDDSGRLTRKDINNVTAILCLGTQSTKKSTPAVVKERAVFMTKFWKTISEVKDFGRAGAKSKCLAAQPVVLKALAKLSHDLAYGHQNIADPEEYKLLIESISSGKLDFSHKNVMWRALMMPQEERMKELPGLEKYLFIPSEINLDAGMYDVQNGWVRFGNKHNDIFPRLGDVIRWKLKLKVRTRVTKAIEAHYGRAD